MRRHKAFDFRTAYIDLLLNVLTGMIFLFVLTTLLIQPPKKSDEGVKRDAEFIVDAEWNPDVDCDADLWVRDPSGQLVYFERKDSGYAHLERDNLGFKSNQVTDVTGKVLYTLKQNKETWVLRGKVEGEFVVNMHLYACKVDGMPQNIGVPMNLSIKLELTKVNPTVTTIHIKTIILEKVWGEKTAFTFTLDRDGNVVSIDDNAEVNLVKVRGLSSVP